MFQLDIEVSVPVKTAVQFDTVTGDQVIGALTAFANANPAADWSTLHLQVSATPA